MSLYRAAIPQLSGKFFLSDAGLETDLIFNHGVEIPEFAAHTLLLSVGGRRALSEYFRPFLQLAREQETGFILNSQTWKTHSHWKSDLDATIDDLRRANHDSIDYIASLRDEFKGNTQPIVLCAIIGPRGDGYAARAEVAPHEAEEYHAQQIAWLAETEVDMLTATTFTQSGEAIGIVRAAQKAGLPIVVSFTVETDGRLPTGQDLGEAICAVDEATDRGPAYFQVNCAHPDHFAHVLEASAWARRIRGIRCNASRKSHAELDESESLDAGSPAELAQQYMAIREKMPWLNVFGGCCGSDLRHVVAIVQALRASDQARGHDS